MSAAESEPTDAVHPTDLSVYQQEALYAIADAGPQKGLEVLDTLEDRFGDQSMSHGRLYPNLDTLADLGLVEKKEVDGRTNRYQITGAGKDLLRRDAQYRAPIAEDLGRQESL